MPTCGHCGKSVAASDVTCPHCGVLLAAYASPEGSGAAGTYEAPPAPPSAVIPDIDMEVKPPSEADIVTDPTAVAEEQISTAPRPLFDTYLTVEEIARAAEGENAEDVVTVADGKVATKKVDFDVPDYARPPSDAAPIPTIEEDDESVPLITRDSASAEEPGDNDVDNNPPVAGESWLKAARTDSTPRAAPKGPPNPKVTTAAKPAADSGPGGRTDAYLRQLHQEADYTPSNVAVSQPVAQPRKPPAERARNRRSALPPVREQQAAAEKSTNTGCSVLYVLVLAVVWFSVITSVMTGSLSPFLIFLAFAMTWGFGPVRKFINEVRQS